MRHFAVRFAFVFLSVLALASQASAATYELRLLLDTDDDPATGCAGIPAFTGAEAVVVTGVEDDGVHARVTGVALQRCVNGAFGSPVTFDNGGWDAGTNGNLVIESHLPLSLLGNHAERMRAALVLVNEKGNSFAITKLGDGSPIYIPPVAAMKRRAVGSPDAPAPALDGNANDWNTTSLFGAQSSAVGRVSGFFARMNAAELFFRLDAILNAPGVDIVASDDAFNVRQGQSLSVTAPGVLANDSDVSGRTLSAQLESDPTHGSVSLQPNGSFTYAHDGSALPSDVFSYRAAAGSDTSAPASVTINVTPDQAPVVANDAYSVAHGGTVSIPPPGVLANDSDPEGDPMSAELAAPPQHGSALVNADGSLTYQHDGSNTLTDFFLYRVRDGVVVSGNARVDLTIGANQAPVAVDDSFGVNLGGTLDANLYTNDNDADTAQSLWSTTIVTQPVHGTLTAGANGAIHYVHDGSLVGTDSFTYQISDGIASSNVATVTIAVTIPNQAPVANADAYSVNEDAVLTIVAPGVLGNDTDFENATLTASVVATTQHGTLTLQADGSFVYTPAANYHGPDSFTYVANDGSTSSSAATVTITVASVNDAPVAVDDATGVIEGQSVSGSVSGNDSDADSDPLTFAVVANPLHGALTLNADGTFAYLHDGTDSGNDAFTYSASDGTATSNVATVTIVVTPVNDAPVAVADAFTVNEGATLNGNVASNDTDEESNALSATVVTNVTHGALTLNADGTFTYVHDGSDSGNDSFTYKVNDGTSDSNTVTVTITVTAVNDAPVAVNDAFTVNEGGTASGNVATNDTDEENAALSASVVTNVTHGALTLNADGTFTYVHDGTDSGDDSFTYKVNDGTSDSNVATVTIAVTALNDAPVAVADSVGVNEGGTVNGNVLTNDSDEEGSTLTAALVTNVAHGALTLNADGTFTYVHDGTDSGNDSFTYKANDGTSDSNVVTVTITVTALNDAPVASDDAFGVNEGATLNGSVITNDTDEENNSLSASVVTGTAHGALTLNANGTFSYVHDGTDSGNDSFTYKVNDGTSDSNVATVTIAVTALNDAPVAVADAVTVNEAGNITGNVLTNDSDEEGNTITAALVTNVAHGTLTLNADGSFSYTHDGTDSGNDSFTYKANDGTTVSAPVAVTITVTALNDAPVANDDAFGVNEAATLNGNVVTNDSDEENDTLVATVVTPPAHGALTLNANGTFSYVHDGTESGDDSFTYTVNDGALDSNVATVTIAVTATNDAPVAVDDAYTVTEGQTVNALVSLLDNDTDEENNSLTPTVVTNPAHGTLLFFGSDGTFLYKHDGTDSGNDSFTYKVNDGTSDSNVATVTINVTAVDDPPVALDDSYGVTEGQTLNGASILANDFDEEGQPLTLTVLSTPVHGSFSMNPDGTFTYVHDGSNNGDDSFTYKVTAGGVDSNDATVTIAVTHVNDAPVAVGDTYGVFEGQSVTGQNVLSNDADEELNPLTAILVTPPAHGTLTLNADGTFTYVHDGTDTGNDSFVYKANDGNSDSSNATVTIIVTPINDSPVAVADSFPVNEGGNVSGDVLVNDTDEEGNTLTVSLVTNVAHGSLSLNANGTFSYTHDGTDSGDDSFTYKANDGSTNSNTVTVTLQVTATNDAPVAVNDAFGVTEGQTLSATSILANDTDEENNTLTPSVVTPPLHGALTLNSDGTFTYVHDGTDTGNDSFTYKVNDGALDSNVATVTITVTATNDAPLAAADNYPVNEAGTLNIAAAAGVLANDSDEESNPLTAILVTNVTHGSLTLNSDGSFTYIHDGTDTGDDSFIYKANDGTSDSNVATVTIPVTAQNDAPVAGNDSYTTTEGGTLNIAAPGVRANDSDEENDPLTAILVSNVTHGTLTLNADGSFSYTHDGTETLSDSFTYKLNDGALDSNVATVTITVTSVNDAPVAGNDTLANSAEDVAVTVAKTTLLANDNAGPGEGAQTITLLSVGSPTHGTVAISGTNVVFTPTLNYTGPASFQYTIQDNGTTNGSADPKTSTATVNFTLWEVNDLPLGANDSASVLEDNPITILSSALLANDKAGPLTDGDGLPTADETTQTIRISSLGVAGVGSATLAADGSSITYTPPANFSGSVVAVPYRITDNGTTNGVADPKTRIGQSSALITVIPVNDAPTANADTRSMAENSVSTFAASQLTINDSAGPSEGSQILTVTSVQNASIGTVSLSGGNITITPPADYNGPLTFQYTITDDGTTNGSADPLTATGTVTVTVTEVNATPIAGNDAKSTVEDTPFSFPASDLLANDSAGANEAAQTITVTAVSSPVGGTVGLAAGVITFTPTADFFGAASFQYTVTDNGTTNGAADPKSTTATVNVTISEVNDAPVATTDAKSVAEDATLSFPATDLLANDSKGNAFESAQTLTVTSVSNPVGGTVTLVAGTITFTPNADFNGAASFDYAISDDGTTNGAADAKTASGTVNVTVTEINDAPTAVADAKTTAEDVPLSFAASTLTTNDSKGPANEAGQTLTVTAVGSATNGTVSLVAGNITFTPAANFSGSASFQYTVTDDGTTNGAADPKTSSATVTITITEVNDAPVANADAKSTNEDTPLVFPATDLLANDTKGDAFESAQTITVTGVSNPVNGTVSLVAGNITFTPAANFFGTATFDYTITDNGTTNGAADPKSGTGTVTITVVSVNDAPVAVSDSYNVPPAGTLNVAAPGVLANDSDVETPSASLTAILVTNVTEGTLTLNANGSFDYTKAPASVALGDSFTYKVNDGSADSNTVTVSLNFNSPPVAVDDTSYFMVEDQVLTVPAGSGLRVNDSDPDNNITNVIIVSAPANGVLSPTSVTAFGTELPADGSFTYTPQANFFGTDTFTYKLRDAGGLESAPATVSILVNAINDEPTFTAPTTTITLLEDAATYDQPWASAMSPGNAFESAQTINFRAQVTNSALFDNDFQCTPPGIYCSVAVSPVAVDSSTGHVVFKLAANANGTSNVTVDLHDDGGVFSPGDDDTSQPVTFTVNVTPVNDAPTFVKGADQQVDTADGVTRTVNAWAAPSSFSVGPADEVSAGQTITSFSVTNVSDSSFFTTQPAVNQATGTLTFTPVNNAAKTGQVTVTVTITDNGGTANGGANSSSQTFIINFGTAVNANKAPKFNVGTDKTFAAGTTGLQTYTFWATGIDKGAVSESWQTLNFIVDPPSNPSIFTVGGEPAVSPTGTLTFTLSGTTGGSTMVVRLHDDGGTAFGGQDTSAPKTFYIFVGSVNQPPSFTKGPNVTVNEDSAPYSAAWATNINPNAGGSTVSFTVTVDNPALFSVQPTVSSTGVLSFTLAPDAFGSILGSIVAKDDGGTANGGVDTSPAQGFNIFINAVNDPPSFTLSPNPINVAANSGPVTISGWIPTLSYGPANEGTQAPVTFTITQTSTTNPALFTAGPTLDNYVSRNLSFTPADNQSGSATYTIQAKDTGGNANGGNFLSPLVSFTINVTGSGFPVLPAGSGGITAYANIPLSITNDPSDQPYRLLEGATDPIGNELPLTATITQKPVGSIVTIDDPATGAFTFRNGPLSYAAGAISPQQFKYHVCDAGGNCSTERTVVVSFFAPLVFFSDDNAPATATAFGTLDIPVKGMMPGFTDHTAPDATYIIMSGNYSVGPHGTTLGTHIRSGDKVLGQGIAGLTFASLGITDPPVGTLPALPDLSTGTTPSIYATTPWGSGTGSYISDANIGAVFVGLDGGTVKNLNVSEQEEKTGSWLLFAPGGAGYCCTGSPYGTTGNYFFDRVTLANGQGFVIGPEGSSLTLTNSNIRSSAPFGVNNATITITNTPITVDSTGDSTVTRCLFISRTGSGIPVLNVNLTTDAASPITLSNKGYLFDPGSNSSTPIGTYTFNGAVTINRTTAFADGLEIYGRPGHTFAFNGKVDVTVNRGAPLNVHASAVGAGTLTMPNAANTFKLTNATNANVGTAIPFSGMEIGAAGVNLSNLAINGGNLTFTDTAAGAAGPIAVKSGTVKGNGAQQCVIKTNAANVTVDPAVVFTNCTP